MADIPKTVLETQPTLEGLRLRARGKVRDSYDLLDHPGKMLVVASDRISIFDFVLSTLVADKGAVLTALNYFWVCGALDMFKTDMIACGARIDEFLPENLRGDMELQKRSTVVELLPAPDVEDIVRIVLTGSGWKSYQKDGTVCGHRLPPGLSNGSMLPYPIYTPTTKATKGHDEHITADSVADRYGVRRERLALQAAQAIASYAREHDIILADTKFEFSLHPDGYFVLADEKGTPDSSRFVDAVAWKDAVAKGNFPPSLDKQFVREWGNGVDIADREPTNSEDVAYVHDLSVPDDVVKMTTRIYRYIFWRLTSQRIEHFQRLAMGITDVEVPRRRIEVLLGSESDFPQTKEGLVLLKRQDADVSVTAISCHRNPEELRSFASERLVHADVVIAGAGWAAALPGIVKSYLCVLDRPDIPVIGVAFDGGTDERNKAATLSIECLPSQPVELSTNGSAYFGSDGFRAACSAAVMDEFLPRTVASKPVKSLR